MNKHLTYKFIPTDKASRIVLKDKTKTLILYDTDRSVPHSDGFAQQYLYILSDDEIKEGDWGTDGEYVFKVKEIHTSEGLIRIDSSNFVNIFRLNTSKKIIATTNPELQSKWTSAGFGAYKVEDGIDRISESDIEYIISLYNGKGKEVDAMQAHARNFSGLMNAVDMEDEKYYNSHTVKIYEAFIQGWKTSQCLSDDTDKKLKELISELKEMLEVCLPEFKTGIQHSILRASSHLENAFEQPKRDTVMVIYKKEISKEIYTPVIQDGCIVIVRN